MNTRRLLAICTVVGAGALGGCQSTGPSAPAITAAMSESGARQHADPATLASGRGLFAGRCARCHALPVIAEHSGQKWPGIVAQMAKRSGLQPDQSRAVLAYILTARQQ